AVGSHAVPYEFWGAVVVPAVARGDDRTPELVRDRMAAYREGWTRGGGRPPGAARGTARPSTEGEPA
ncbi:hypothetical protein, partial [Streptomyces tunisiensis]|uniref:hypothetical protein n=1 Tax=Streptomyces tunisiensis TaxID=948699 RepID=UPI003EE053A8